MNGDKISKIIIGAVISSAIIVSSKHVYAADKINNSVKQQQNQLNGKVINVSTNLRMRLGPSTDTAVISYLKEGQALDIIGKSEDWYKVDILGRTGFVHKDYVKIIDLKIQNSNAEKEEILLAKPAENKVGTLKNVSTSLRLRTKPSTSSASTVLAYIYPKETFQILGQSGEWYKVNYKGKNGYVYKDYVKLSNASNTEDNNNDNEQDQSKKYEEVLKIMKSQIGAPYVYGGAGELLTMKLINNLKIIYTDYASEGKYDNAAKEVGKDYRAFDCSGLMYWAFKQVGVNLGRSTYDQINNGVEVDINRLAPGDLLFFKELNHVGMYIGNGQWIEAPNHKACVRITNVPWKSIGRARRILNTLTI